MDGNTCIGLGVRVRISVRLGVGYAELAPGGHQRRCCCSPTSHWRRALPSCTWACGTRDQTARPGYPQRASAALPTWHAASEAATGEGRSRCQHNGRGARGGEAENGDSRGQAYRIVAAVAAGTAIRTTPRRLEKFSNSRVQCGGQLVS